MWPTTLAKQSLPQKQWRGKLRRLWEAGVRGRGAENERRLLVRFDNDGNQEIYVLTFGRPRYASVFRTKVLS